MHTTKVANADKHYTEKLYRMRGGLRAYFLRPYVGPDIGKRQALRQRIMTEMNLPSTVHFYLCPQVASYVSARPPSIIVAIHQLYLRVPSLGSLQVSSSF